MDSNRFGRLKHANNEGLLHERFTAADRQASLHDAEAVAILAHHFHRSSERNRFRRFHGSAGRRAIAVDAVGELVDVIAEVDHRVEIVAIGDAAIDVEESRGIVGARHRRQAEAIDAVGQGAGAADGRPLSTALEGVIVRPTRTKIAGVDLHREVALRGGLGRPARDDLRQTLVACDLPAHGNRSVPTERRRRRHSSVAIWIASLAPAMTSGVFAGSQ